MVVDKFSGRSCGFGFVTFDEKQAMDEVIEAMNGMDLDGRKIMVEKAQPQGSGRDQDGVAVVIVALIGTLVVDMEVEVEVESALSVTSLGILQGSVLVKGTEEVGMGGGMTGIEEEEVAMGAMILIEMVIYLVGAIGIVVLEEDQEMTAIIGTVVVPVNVAVQETSVRGRKNTPDSKAIGGTAVTCRSVKVSVASLLHGCLGG